LAVAPPSTRSSWSVTPASVAIAASTSRDWRAMLSSVARAMWAPVVPRVRPKMAPRA
jgi:hypothetical protein